MTRHKRIVGLRGCRCEPKRCIARFRAGRRPQAFSCRDRSRPSHHDQATRFSACGLGRKAHPLARYGVGSVAIPKDHQKAGQSQPASSSVQADERINEVLAPVRDEHHLPGLIGAIQTGNRLAAIGALGIRKIGSPEPIRVTDQVHLGSCTKAMTATMIGTLIDEGKLTWRSTIREVFPTRPPTSIPTFRL